MESERMHIKVVIYEYAMRMIGLPYRWGGDDLIDGLDCSGLCVELLRAAGVVDGTFDASADGLWHYPAFPEIDAPRFGALAFFGKPNVSHVGWCMNETHMIEAGGGTSATTTRAAAEKQNAYVRVRPIKARKDFVGVRMPTYPWKG